MATQTLNLSYTVHDDFDSVYQQLLDFRKFGALHPFMKQVNLLSENNGAALYEVFEEIKLLGFIPMKPNYKVEVTQNATDKTIRYYSEAQKGVYLTIDFSFVEDLNNKCIQVIEAISLKSNPIVGFVFLRILKNAHMPVFKNMDSAGLNKRW